jgi:gliding motility-associated-like protein
VKRILLFIILLLSLAKTKAQVVIAGGEKISVTLPDELSVKENLTNSGTVYKLNMVGSSTQTIGGSGIFKQLTIKNAAGVSLSLNLTVIDSGITLTSGLLRLGSYYLSASSISGATSANYIQTNGIGMLTMSVANNGIVNFPLGNTAYNPIEIKNKNASQDSFSVRVYDQVFVDAASIKGMTNVVNHTWVINKKTANAAGGVDLKFNWNSGEVTGTIVNPAVYYYSGTAWLKASGTVSVSGTSATLAGYTGSLNNTSFVVASDTNFIPISPDANLLNLLANGVTFTSSFDSTKTTYTANTSLSSVTVTPTAANAGATITVNGTVVKSGSASGVITLNSGTNTINVIATASDGVTIKTYTVTINKFIVATGALKITTSLTQPSCKVSTGNITITTPTGAGITYSIDGITYQSSNVFSNLKTGSYLVSINSTVSGYLCADSLVVLNAQPATPVTPTVTASPAGPVCSRTAVTLYAGSSATAYQWYLDGILIAGATSQTYNTVLPGSYTLITINSAGCPSAASTTKILTFDSVPHAIITNGTLVGLTCNQPRTVLTAPAGTGYQYQWYRNGVSLGAASNINTHVDSIAGDYTVKITTASFCSDSSIATKVIPAATSSSGKTSICVGDSSYLKVYAAYANAIYQWQISENGLTGWSNIIAPGATTDSLNINNTVAAFRGTNYYQVVLTDAYNSNLKDTTCPVKITINSLPTVNISSSPNDTVCAGTSVVLTANATGIPPYQYQWQSGGIKLSTDTLISYAANVTGKFAVSVTDNNGCKNISDTTFVQVNPIPSKPIVLVTNPTCNISTGTINISTPLGSGIKYIITNTSTSDTITSTERSGLVAGTYSIKVINAAGCVGGDTIVTIKAQPTTPTKPSISIVQPTCVVATGAITVTSPIGVGLTYSIDGTTYQSDTVFNGLAAGTYKVTVRNADGCVSADSMVVMNAQPTSLVKPTLSVVQPNCTTISTGSINISTPLGSGIKYIITNTSTSDTITSTVKSGLGAGTYSIKVINAAGCVGEDTSILIKVQPTTPTKPSTSIVQPTCTVATGAITVTSPIGVGLTYSIDGATYQSDTVFNGLAVGTYKVTVRNADGCVSTDSMVVMNAQPTSLVKPTLSVVQPTCLISTGSIKFNSSLNNVGDKYIVIQPFRVDTITAESIDNLVAGTYSVKLINAAGCLSEDTTITILLQPIKPETPTITVVNSTCSLPTGTLNISAPLGNSIRYVVTGISTLDTLSNTNGSYAPGSYHVKVLNAVGCLSDSIPFVIDAPPASPSQPIVSATQPNCTVATGLIEISALMGLGEKYIITGPTSADTISNTSINNLVAGTYKINALSTNGCISAATSITIVSQPTTPDIPTILITQPSCTSSTGTVTIAAPIGSDLQYTMDGITYQSSNVFYGVRAGNYFVRVSNTAGCYGADTSVVLNVQPPSPHKPTAIVIQPTCTVATGTININSPYNTGDKYIITGISLVDTITATSKSGLLEGVYSIQTLNTGGCLSNSTNVVVNAQPATPIEPVVSVTQPTCNIPTGSIYIITPDGSGEKYILSGTLSIDTITKRLKNGLNSGNYRIKVLSANGCMSADTSISINDQPATPAKPIPAIIQPSCTTATGVITVTSPLGAGLVYSIDGTNYQSDILFNGVAAGDYHLKVVNALGCMSTDSVITVHSQPATPVVPTVSLIQSNCAVATGTITVSAPTGSGEKYIIAGNSITDTIVVNSKAGVTAGLYSVKVLSNEGCVSADTTVVIEAQPAASIKPVVVVTQPTCTIATGSITITAPFGSSERYIISGKSVTDTITSTWKDGLVAGQYSVSVLNTKNCISVDTVVTIHAQPAIPSQPVITSSNDNNICDGSMSVFTCSEGAAYQWVKDGEIIGGATAQTYATVIPGYYTVIITGVGGCTSEVSTPVTLTVNRLPIATISNGFEVGLTCKQPKTILTAPKGLGYTYEWFRDQVSLGDPSLSNEHIDSISGNYTVKVTTVASCTDSSVPTKIIPAAKTNSGGISICKGDSTYLKVVSEFAHTAYEWQISADGGANWNKVTAVGFDTDSLPVSYAVPEFRGSNYYKVILYNLDNTALIDTTCPIQITINELPTIVVYNNNTDTICAGTNILLNSKTTSSGVLSYQWKVNGIIVPDDTLASYSVTTSGKYTLLVTDKNGCKNSSDTSFIQINSVPGYPVIAVTQPTCTEANGAITINAPIGIGLKYIITSATSIDTITATTKAGLAAGTYSIKVLNSSGCMSADTSITIQAQPTSPAMPNVLLAHPTCNIATGAITITAPFAVGLTYTIDGERYQSSPVFNGVVSGNHFVRVSNAFGCLSADSVVVINAQPTTAKNPQVVAVQPSCTVSTGSIEISLPKEVGEKYIIAGVSAVDTIATNILNNLAAGVYSIRALNTNGCVSADTTLIIHAQPAPPIKPKFSVYQPTCTGSTGSITINVPVGSTERYLITGATSIDTINTNTKLGLLAGKYNIKVLSASGCLSLDTAVQINLPPFRVDKPNVTLQQTSCSESTGIITVTNPIGTGFTYSLDGLIYQYSPVFNGVNVGNYHVKVGNQQGCISIDSLVVIQAQPVTPAKPVVSVVQPTCKIATGTITINTPIGSGVKYIITGISSVDTIFTNIRTGLMPGVYTIKVLNTVGCESDDTAVVILAQPSNPIKPVIEIVQPTCAVATGSINIINPKGNGEKYIVRGTAHADTLNTTAISSLAVGLYTLKVIDIRGCVSVDSAMVNIVQNKILNKPATIIGTQTVSAGATEVYSIQPVAGAKTYTWLLPIGWAGASTTTSISVVVGSASGIISVVANADVCVSDTSKLFIDVLPIGILPVTTAIDDYDTTVAGKQKNGNVLQNDQNSVGAKLTASILSGPKANQGILIFNADGTYNFTPADGYTGSVNIVYVACGGVPISCDTATLHVFVKAEVVNSAKTKLYKTVESIDSKDDGGFIVKFKISVTNQLAESINNLVIQDDLSKVFKNINDFEVIAVEVSGKLVKNIAYNGSNDIDLVRSASSIDGGRTDSIYLTVKVKPSLTDQQLNNVATLKGLTTLGAISLVSDDPSINPSDTLSKDETPFFVPAAEVIVSGGFSPNNDGIDDKFIIRLPQGSTDKISLMVFNRWSVKVYSNNNYDNTWDGRSPNSLFGQYLPSGTYFYVVYLNKADGHVKKYAGTVTIAR